MNPEQLASRKEHSPAELEIRIAEWKNERIAAKRRKRRIKATCFCTAIAYIVRSLRKKRRGFPFAYCPIPGNSDLFRISSFGFQISGSAGLRFLCLFAAISWIPASGLLGIGPGLSSDAS